LLVMPSCAESEARSILPDQALTKMGNLSARATVIAAPNPKILHGKLAIGRI